MSSKKLEERVARLEAEIAQIKRGQVADTSASPWWDKVRGRFRDDPAYDEAMTYGKDYRESLRQPGDQAS
jgi:hypothetical protein